MSKNYLQSLQRFCNRLYYYNIDSGQINNAIDNCKAYFAVASELSKLKRLERLTLAEAMIEKQEKADKVGSGYKLCIFDKEMHNGYLVYSDECDRATRIERIGGLCIHACVEIGIRQVVGIATEPASYVDRSFDFTFINLKISLTRKERKLRSIDSLIVMRLGFKIRNGINVFPI